MNPSPLRFLWLVFCALPLVLGSGTGCKKRCRRNSDRDCREHYDSDYYFDDGSIDSGGTVEFDGGDSSGGSSSNDSFQDDFDDFDDFDF